MSSSGTRGVLAGWAASVCLVSFAALLFLRSQRTDPAIPEAWTQAEPTALELPAPQTTTSGDLLLHRLPAGLDEAEIYDLEMAASGLWVGTGKGLVHRSPEGEWFVYRRFPNPPGEWMQAVAVTDRGVATSVWVAGGSTSGTPMGTFVFRPSDQAWIKMGETSFVSLDWDGTWLWGLLGTRLQRTSPDPERTAWEEVDPGVRICTEGRLAAAGSVWLAQQGAVQIGRPTSRQVPCGVVALDPASGEARVWKEEDGLASGFGRTVVGDTREVWAAHGVQGEGLSRYDVASGQWSALRSSRNGVYLGPTPSA